MKRCNFEIEASFGLPLIMKIGTEFAEFARMKSVLKALKLGKTDKITPKSLGKTDGI